MAQTTRSRRGFVLPARVLPALVAALLAAVLGLAGCSSDDGETPKGDGDRSGAAEVTTNARLGRVRGKLGKAREAKVLADVTTVVEHWSDAAYDGAGSSDPKGAFGAFTGDARALAAKQTALSNGQVKGDVGDAAITRRVVRVDVIAAGGRPVGATARISLTVELPGLDRADRIRGRLMLTPAKGGWKVFGFDVRRGEGAS